VAKLTLNIALRAGCLPLRGTVSSIVPAFGLACI
jgi:hypothetical protein